MGLEFLICISVLNVALAILLGVNAYWQNKIANIDKQRHEVMDSISEKQAIVTEGLIVAHEAWDNSNKMAQCPSCRANLMLRGATWHG